MPKPRDAQTDADHEGRTLVPPKTTRRTEKMEIRTEVELSSGKVHYSKWSEASEDEMRNLAGVRKTLDSGLGNLTRFTLETERGPLYINPAHIATIRIEERN